MPAASTLAGPADREMFSERHEGNAHKRNAGKVAQLFLIRYNRSMHHQGLVPVETSRTPLFTTTQFHRANEIGFEATGIKTKN